MANASLSAPHTGRQTGEGEALHAIIAGDTRKPGDSTLLLKMRGVVTWALSGAALTSSAGKLRQAAANAIAADPEKSVQVLPAKTGASKAGKSAIVSALIKGAGLNAWGCGRHHIASQQGFAGVC